MHCGKKIDDKEPAQVFEILNQSVWNNKYILKQDESLFYPYLCKKGISQIKDLIDVNTTASLFLNWNSAKLKFNLTPNDFMSWTCILEAIDPKRSGRPCTLQFLCLCDDIDEIPSKILETIESFAISICNGKKYAHSYCSGELELLKMNETDL